MNFENTEIAFSYKSKKELLKAFWLFKLIGNATLTKIGTSITPFLIHYVPFSKAIIKNTIFKQFCGGESLQEADITALNLKKFNIDTIMDYSLEGKSNEAEYDKTTQEFINTILFAKTKNYIPFISIKITAFAALELLEKWHLNIPLNENELLSKERILTRIEKICQCAFENNTKILIDAEESWIQHPIDEIAFDMMKKFNTQNAIVFNTYQLYRWEMLENLKKAHQHAIENNYFLGAKLVRGAYMEKERARAIEKNYTSPIQETKEKTDIDYNLAVEFCLENINKIALFIGTHNEESCKFAIEKMNEKNIDKTNDIFFSQLFGMSDNISFNLANAGYHVSKYLPYGPVKDVIPYLMRRAKENTSVAGQTTRELNLINKEIERRKK
ncbi:MAG: proline dehydrogenase family protein [Chitinophagaceae bacterium]|nr:proline dehydrogenase family protein [Chitinophagaceae bacterium]